MTTRLARIISCDGAGCTETLTYDQGDFRADDRAVDEHGWAIECAPARFHFCPAHIDEGRARMKLWTPEDSARLEREIAEDGTAS
jgi:hypothetical protein